MDIRSARHPRRILENCPPSAAGRWPGSGKGGRATWPASGQLDLGQADCCGFRPLAAFGDIDDDALAFVEPHQPGPLQRRGMHEHVLAAAIAHDKAEPLHRVVPLDGAALLRGHLERRTLAASRAASWTKTAAGSRPQRPWG